MRYPRAVIASLLASVCLAVAGCPPAPKSDEPAVQPADDPIPKVLDLSAEEVRALLEFARSRPELKKQIAAMRPELGEALGVPYPDFYQDQPDQPPTISPTAASLEESRRKADALVARLADADETGLAEIEDALCRLGRVAMVPLKLAELSDNFELRRRAGKLADRMRWRLACSEAMLAAFPRLVDVMSCPDQSARAALVDWIAGKAGPWAIGFLDECLADPQTYVRQRAIDGLVKAAGWRGEADPLTRRVADILETAMGDDDRNIRLLAVGAISKIGATRPDRLAEMLDDESMEVRITVIRAMGHSRKPTAVQHIKPLLNDPQWRIRAAALEAIGDLVRNDQAGSVSPAVAGLLNDEDSYVRALAAKLLKEWKKK